MPKSFDPNAYGLGPDYWAQFTPRPARRRGLLGFALHVTRATAATGIAAAERALGRNTPLGNPYSETPGIRDRLRAWTLPPIYLVYARSRIQAGLTAGKQGTAWTTGHLEKLAPSRLKERFARIGAKRDLELAPIAAAAVREFSDLEGLPAAPTLSAGDTRLLTDVPADAWQAAWQAGAIPGLLEALAATHHVRSATDLGFMVRYQDHAFPELAAADPRLMNFVQARRSETAGTLLRGEKPHVITPELSPGLPEFAKVAASGELPYMVYLLDAVNRADSEAMLEQIRRELRGITAASPAPWHFAPVAGALYSRAQAIRNARFLAIDPSRDDEMRATLAARATATAVPEPPEPHRPDRFGRIG